jgi:transcriptional regulator with XRE-family HTH domain
MAEDPSPSPAATAGRRRADDIDRAVGRRIRHRRLELALTLQQLAELVGVTQQQVHKHETGISRISAGLLHRIAQALGVEVGHFFVDMDAEGHGPAGATGQRRRLLELVRHVAGIGDPRLRQALGRLARDLAALGAENPEDAQVEQLPAQSEAQPDRSR